MKKKKKTQECSVPSKNQVKFCLLDLYSLKIPILFSILRGKGLASELMNWGSLNVGFLTDLLKRRISK